MRTRRLGTSLVLALCLGSPFQLAASPNGNMSTIEAPHPRERLFGHDDTRGVNDFLQTSPRWTILFAPNIAECTPQELEVVRALRTLMTDFPELRVATVLPEGVPERVVARGVFGESFPGELIRVDTESWDHEAEVAPRPRLEVWSRRGELLLMRSIPPTATAAGLLEDLTWARSFTSAAESEEIPN